MGGQIIKCGECRFFRIRHYGYGAWEQEPYVEMKCTNKFGLNNDYNVRKDDFCSRAESRKLHEEMVKQIFAKQGSEHE